MRFLNRSGSATSALLTLMGADPVAVLNIALPAELNKLDRGCGLICKNWVVITSVRFQRLLNKEEPTYVH